MVGGHGDVGGAGLDHAEHRAEHAARRRYFAAIAIARRRDGVEMAE
jgi:hypothetical protein